MAELICNVFAGDEWWGPYYGNADAVPPEVAAEIGDHCWDEPPVRPVASLGRPWPFTNGGSLEPGLNRVENVSGEREGLSAGSAGALADELTGGGQGDEGVAAGETVVPEPAPPVDLDAMSLDDLRVHAEAKGIVVDKRWGADRLRTEIGKPS